MKPRKEHYRRKLPHFQQPGQWYSVTFTLAGAMPKGAMDRYSSEIQLARTRLKELSGQGLSQVRDITCNIGKLQSPSCNLGKLHSSSCNIGKLHSRAPDQESEFPNSDTLVLAKMNYQIALRRYRLAYDRILNKLALPGLILAKEENRKIIENTLLFWEGKRLTNHAWCIMSNHVHWMLSVFERDENGKPVFLQDILHSVKLFTARRINENENMHGQFWEHESFETTIRNDCHFVRAFNYTIQNPVKAGLVQYWQEWPGTRTFPSP